LPITRFSTSSMASAPVFDLSLRLKSGRLEE
jgi:hypothetical protein